MTDASLVKRAASAVRPFLVHADWGSNPKKRWMCVAEPGADGSYHVYAPELVGEPGTLLGRVLARAEGAHVMLGFDFPIGVPMAYAQKAGIESFPDLLRSLGRAPWERFYDVAEHADEIELTRPFYPMRPGGTKQHHLSDALGLGSMGELLRVCERKTETRGPASPLFWTLGGKQVGKAAIIGWRDVLTPALQDPALDVAVWPFDGSISVLTMKHAITIAETYPAEACLHLGMTPPGRTWSKTSQEGRSSQRGPLSDWARARGALLAPELRALIDTGFGPSKDAEDPFDALLGLLSMVDVILGFRADGAPDDEDVRKVEGWILGCDSTSILATDRRGSTTAVSLPAPARAGPTTPIITVPRDGPKSLDILAPILDEHQGTLFVTDFYIDGAEHWLPVAGGWKHPSQPIVNVDHHAPHSSMQREVSSTNLAIELVKTGAVPGPDDAVLVSHMDCDSVLSAGILSRRLESRDEYGAAAIAADHTGEEHPIADLLQALDAQWSRKRRSMPDPDGLEYFFDCLDRLERGEELDSFAREALDARAQGRREAETLAKGHVVSEGGVCFVELQEPIEGELLLPVLPSAWIVATASQHPKNPERWQIKIRRGRGAPAWLSLHDLGLTDVDPAYGGRWNAGSNNRGGGTELSPADYRTELVRAVDARRLERATARRASP